MILCCFKNIVDNMIKIVNMCDTHLQEGCFLNCKFLQRAISHATEAYTCKLGKMFVGVSMVYNMFTNHLKILSDANTGLKS